MPSNYQRSYEILWERRKRPSLAYPNGCDMFENGAGDLGPCWDCMHCHDEAYEIEAELDAEQEKQGP